MSSFHFLRPLWFLALPPLLGLLWLLWQRRLRSHSWQEVCDPALLPHLLLGRSKRRANWPLLFMLISLLTVVTCLAGPTWRRLPQPLFRQQSALVICLDLSRSMLAADLKPNRLVRARLKIQDILRQRREGQTALLAFAGDAFAITPLTSDYHTIESLLNTLEPNLMPVQGSAPGRAFTLGTELLQQAGLKRGTLLLVTDEDKPELAEVAANKLPQGVTLQVLGVGTPEGAPIPLDNGGFFKDGAGNLALPRLNEAGLQKLANSGGGSYRRISIDDSDFTALLSNLKSHRLDQAEAALNRIGDRWEEAGVWLLWLLVIPAAAAFRRGWLTVFVLLLLSPQPAKAFDVQGLWQRPDQQAQKAFAAGQYDAAANRFEDPRWKASSLYRAGRYAEALKALPEAKTADDWYNRGNAQAQSGQLDEALKSYDQALNLAPKDEDTLTNRELVAKALEKQQQEQQQQSQSEKQQGDQQPPGKDQKQPAEKNSTQQSERSRQQTGSDSSDAGEDKPGKENTSAENSQKNSEQAKPSAADSEQQRQQQKMKPSNEETAAKENPETAAAASSSPTAEERELQHWLQGIPDDPGGLLRRKFLYQYRNRGEQLETDRPW